MAKEWLPNAEQLADSHFEEDPIRDLEPSLLSARHIEYYVRVAGLLDCFDGAALKTASYEVPIRGEVICWDQDRVRVRKTITDADTSLELPPNSITFVEVEPTFRLPRYIALRYNLRIHHVHRGLLLGTGPLIDPGFRGKILIPLHNLTATPYDMDLSKALIWVEFTKTSFGRGPDIGPEYRERDFPSEARYRTAMKYLQNANGGFPIVSSIPDAVQKAADRAEAAQTSSEGARETLEKIRGFGLAALLTAVGGIAAIVFSCLGIVGTLRTDLATYQEKSSSRLTALETNQSDAARWETTRSQLEKEIADLKTLVTKLREQVPKSEAVPANPVPPKAATGKP